MEQPLSKQPRILGVPIVLDPLVLEQANVAKENLDNTSGELLSTFLSRRDQKAALEGIEPDEAAKALYAEDQAELERLKGELAAAQEALREATRIYQFRSLGYRAWRALKAAHPSKDKGLAFDEDSIAPTLLREASYDPKMSAEMVEEILTSPDWSEGEVHLLLRTAVGAQS